MIPYMTLEEINILQKNGSPLYVIAQLNGCSIEMLVKYMNGEDIAEVKEKKSLETRDFSEALRLYKNGVSDFKISILTGIPRSTLKRWRDKNNLKAWKGWAK